MTSFRQGFRLTCPRCRASQTSDLPAAVRRLHEAGMLRRQAQPPLDLVEQLLPTAAARLACPACGSLGLACEPCMLDDEWDDWPDAKRRKNCAACGRAINPERLEVFPETTRCAACQSSEERGEPSARAGDDIPYCPRCGDVMQTQQAGGRGIQRYRLKCRGCGAIE